MISVAFIVCEMTFLRHFLPIVEVIENLNLETKIYFLIDEQNSSIKYSSVLNNKNSLIEILKNKKSITVLEQSSEGYDVIFTIEEVCGSFNKSVELSKKLYSLQYFFDYRGIAPSKFNFTKIVYDKIYEEDVKKYYCKKKFLISPTPPALFSVDSLIEHGLKKVNDENHEKKHVTIFYPETGAQSLVEKIVVDLKQKDFSIHVKQRKKHQQIPDRLKNYANVYYDSDWYPSECYYLPVVSNFCIGFGTSAYCELTKVGINFLDVTLTPDSRTYLKPENLHVFNPNTAFVSNYHSLIMEEEKIRTWILKKSLTFEYKKPVVSKVEIQDFVKALLV